MTLEQAEEKIAQAYQVIGVFAHITSGDTPTLKITNDEMLRVQDYFAADHFEPGFLPWPRCWGSSGWNS